MLSPQAGFLVLPLVLAAAWPIVRNHAAVAPLAAATPGGLVSVLWGESVTFAVVAGFLTGLITRDLLQAPFAFIVPSLRERIFTGKTMLAALVAGALAVRLFTISGPGMALPLAASALLFFAVGAALSDPIFPRSAVWVIGALLVVPVWNPNHVRGFFEASPVIATIGALAVAVILARRELDPDITRERMLRPVRLRGTLRDGSLSPQPSATGHRMEWSGRPFKGGLREWVRAIHYENFGAGRFGWPTSVLWAVGLNCGTAYALRNPSFAAIMGLMNLSMGGHRITGRWAYPICRKRRALVLWACTLADSVAYFALAMVVLPLIYALDLPQVNLVAGVTPRYGLLAPLAVAFITAPIVQWPRVTSNLAPAQIMRFGPLWLRVSFRCVGAIAIVTFLLESLFVVQENVSPGAAIAAGLGLVIAFQYFYLVNLRYHFSQSDLA